MPLPYSKAPALEVFVVVLMIGVVNVGEVPKTSPPEPVSLVMAEARFALLGVAKNVATPVANPLTPVDMGNPVALVKVAEEGVPSAGVTNVGEVDKTTFPVPVVLVELITYIHTLPL